MSAVSEDLRKKIVEALERRLTKFGHRFNRYDERCSSAEAAFLARWARWSEERRRPAVEEIEGIIRVRAGGACVSLGGRTNSMSRYYASRKV
jgi:hypothetical protein